jgi:hypothetical protein
MAAALATDMRITGAFFFVITIVGCGGPANCPAVHETGNACDPDPSCSYGECTCKDGVLLCRSALPDMGSCNDLTLDNVPVVQLAYAAQAGPAFSGGTIADGTYVMSGGAMYTGKNGQTGNAGSYQGVYRVSAGKMDVLTVTPAGTSRATTTFSASGTSLMVQVTCGGTASTTESYSATGTTLTTGLLVDGVGPVFTFTRR